MSNFCAKIENYRSLETRNTDDWNIGKVKQRAELRSFIQCLPGTANLGRLSNSASAVELAGTAPWIVVGRTGRRRKDIKSIARRSSVVPLKLRLPPLARAGLKWAFSC